MFVIYVITYELNFKKIIMISPEEENFLRIVYLHYRVVTPVIKRFFDRKHPNLSADLTTNKTILYNLRNPPEGFPRVLYAKQWEILYPPRGMLDIK